MISLSRNNVRIENLKSGEKKDVLSIELTSDEILMDISFHPSGMQVAIAIFSGFKIFCIQ